MIIRIEGCIFRLQRTGGVGRYMRELVGELGGMNELEVELVMDRPEKQRLDFGDGVEVVKNYMPGSRLVPWLEKVNEWKAERYWKSTHHGLVHASYFKVNENCRLPMVVTVYDMIYEKFPQMFDKPAEKLLVEKKKRAIEKADGVICISDAVKADVLRLTGVKGEKVWTTHLAVVEEFAKPVRQNEIRKVLRKYVLKKGYLLWVGKRGKYKNFELLMKVVAKMTHRSKVVCVGGESWTKQEEELMKRHKMEEAFLLLPYPSDQELACLYAGARMLVTGSLDEGFGLTLVEAMACACPVAASDIPVFREVAGKAACWFDPKSAESLRRAIESMDEKARKRLVELGRKQAKKYSWKKTAEKTVEIYRKILNEKGK